MPYDFSPGHVDYNGFNMLPDAPTMLRQGNTRADATLKAGNESFARELAKRYGGQAGTQEAQASMVQAADSSSAVAKENFNAKMAEAQVRAQLHSSYMDLMWKRFQLDNKSDRWGKAGAALGAVGMIGAGLFGGGPAMAPPAGGGAGPGALAGMSGGKAPSGIGAGAGVNFGD